MTVQIAPEAPRDMAILPLRILKAWLQKEEKTAEERYRAKNCSLPMIATILEEQNITHNSFK